jgi:hypothetical protein
LDRLVLTSQVIWQDGRYVARIDGLELEGDGDSVQQAQDALIYQMRAWIELQDGAGTLERSLAEAGYPGVEETTELYLEFLE